MNFIISSSELLSHLQSVGRVISTKNTLPILDNFLFSIKNKKLTITASDLESTLITNIDLQNCEGEAVIAVPAKIIGDILKEFAEQPLTFKIDTEKLHIDILSENGKFSVPYQNGSDFPVIPSVKNEQATKISINPDLFLNGILKTLFATADDELRPVMNGIFIELESNEITFVASDAHKLVRYKRTDVNISESSSFILPKKPASLLRNILPKEKNEVVLEFDEKNAYFTMTDYKLICRLVEGNYPSYNTVIPTNNPNKLVIDRIDFYNTLKRVSLFSNQASNLVKLNLSGNQLTLTAQDIDFSISAHERVTCQYDGEEMDIGFKSTFLLEILANLASTEIVMELSDPTRAGILLPHEKEIPEEDVLMLLMPMMINV
ncbi:MAG: DNA polymerase III subunit beta [Bacteroidota bacterium]